MKYILNFEHKKDLSKIIQEILKGSKKGGKWALFDSLEKPYISYSFHLEFNNIEDLIYIQLEINRGVVCEFEVFRFDYIEEITDPAIIEELDFIELEDQQKISDIVQKNHNKEIKKICNSDLFDLKMVGFDISDQEFINNEIFFELND